MVVTALARTGTYVDASNDPDATEFQFVQDDPGTFIYWISSDEGQTWTRKSLANFENGLGWQLSNEAPRPLVSVFFISLDFFFSSLIPLTATAAPSYHHPHPFFPTLNLLFLNCFLKPLTPKTKQNSKSRPTGAASSSF